jgi:lincosamide nucleotidyltransferase A/C/D/E
MAISAEDVMRLYDELEGAGAPFWFDGGWGVDALLGSQSRKHKDLDIVIEQRHLAAALAYLDSQGFADAPSEDRRDWNFVMAHEDGRVIDFHVIVFDEAGNGIYGPAENDDAYPASSFADNGKIAGRSVRCLSADYQVLSHDSGYELAEKDLADVRALCAAFDLPLPSRFRT